MKKFILFAAVCLFFVPEICAQDALLRRLLDLPAPPPAAKAEDENSSKKPARPEEFYNEENIPPDDAPIEDVFDYWKRKTAYSYYGNNIPPKISEKNAERLLENFAKEPESLNEFLKFFPDDAAIAEKVKNIFDVSQYGEDIDDSWRKTVKEWLKFNSDFYLDELIGEASQAKDHLKYGSVTKQDSLIALTKRNWEKAETILRKLEDDAANPRTQTLAKTLLYKNALAAKDDSEIEKYRRELQKIVSDRRQPARARDAATDALFETEWQGQDEYYLSLMEDESLLSPTDGNTLFSPVTTLPSKNPDKWIPILTKLVGNKNRTIHTAAVRSLMEFENRKDALEPLLPWLSNPDWADIHWSGSDRVAYMQIVSNFDLPESVPGLIWIVENEDDNAHWAARSLGKFKDERAAPALRNALSRIKDESYRKTIIEALLASNGLNDDEQMSALESYAEFITKPENAEEIQKNLYSRESSLPPTISIGNFLAEQTDPSEGLILRLIERQKILQKEKPEVARILSEIMSRWQGRAVDLEMLGRIERGAADAETIVGALARRAELRERVLNELYALRGKSGLAGAIAACLLEDENDIVSAFRAPDAETRIGALACARLLRNPLPVREAGALLDSPDKLLALAAERYLEAEDSPEARALVLAKHPNEALILGARTSFNPAKISFENDYDSPLNKLFSTVSRAFSFSTDFSQLEKSENALRKEILENKELVAIYAQLPNHGTHQRIVRIYKDFATFSYYEDKARFKVKKIEKEELDKFLQALREISVDEFAPKFVSCHYDCYVREFVSLSRDGGRRIFSGSGFGSLGILDNIELFFRKEEYKTRYYLQDKIKNLEVLTTDPKLQPQALWKNGDDFRLLVSDEEKKALIEEEIRQADEIDDKNEDLDYEQRAKNARRRRAERAFEHLEWRKFSDGKFGESTDEPREVPFLRQNLTFPAAENLNANDNALQAIYGNYDIRAGEYNKGGLWKTNRTEQLEIKKGLYAKPVVSGNWVVAAKAEENWAEPNSVVRVNLQTGREARINLPPAEEFYPVAFVAAHNKVLLYRAKEAYSTLEPKLAEYFLLDAATGRTELVKGEFQPFITQTFRALQPAAKANEFWAAVYNRAKNETEIGIYDAKNFTFKTILKMPETLLDSMDVWIDEPESKIYFIYRGEYAGAAHLLRVPLPQAP